MYVGDSIRIVVGNVSDKNIQLHLKKIDQVIICNYQKNMIGKTVSTCVTQHISENIPIIYIYMYIYIYVYIYIYTLHINE